MTNKQKIYSLRTFLMSLLVILAVLIGVYGAGIYQIYHFNNSMVVPEGDDNVIVSLLPDEKGYVYATTGERITLDMGSRHCFIDNKTLELFKQQGYPAVEYPTLLLTTDQSGRYRIYTRKVVMPVFLYERPGSSEVIKFDNMELLISNNEDGNVLGMDFLGRFIIERDNDTGVISLLRSVPTDYSFVSDINGHDSAFGDLFGYSRRLYIPLRVNDQEPQNYYFDTGRGIRSCELVQPLKNVNKATSKVHLDSVTGLMTQNRCRVMIGNRMRFARVTYSDSLHTDRYSINPFKVFNRSIVMDIPSRKLYYRRIDVAKDSIPAS